MSIPTHEPIKMKLQFFASEEVLEDDNPLEDEEPGTDAETDKPDEDVSEKPGEAKHDEQEKEDVKKLFSMDKPKLKVKYMQEEKELEYDEAVTLAQKGMNYDRIHGKLTDLEKKAQRLMSIAGVADLDKAIEHLETEKLRLDAETLAERENISVEEARARLGEQQARKELATAKFAATIEKQKEPLRDKIYFKELEPEIDKIVQESLEKGEPINIETAYHFLRGQRLEELVEQKTDAAKKSTIADMQDKLKRGVAAPSESGKGSTTSVNVDKHMAAIFGNDPKEIASYVAEKMKRR